MSNRSDSYILYANSRWYKSFHQGEDQSFNQNSYLANDSFSQMMPDEEFWQSSYHSSGRNLLNNIIPSQIIQPNQIKRYLLIMEPIISIQPQPCRFFQNPRQESYQPSDQFSNQGVSCRPCFYQKQGLYQSQNQILNEKKSRMYYRNRITKKWLKDLLRPKRNHDLDQSLKQWLNEISDQGMSQRSSNERYCQTTSQSETYEMNKLLNRMSNQMSIQEISRQIPTRRMPYQTLNQETTDIDLVRRQRVSQDQYQLCGRERYEKTNQNQHEWRRSVLNQVQRRNLEQLSGQGISQAINQELYRESTRTTYSTNSQKINHYEVYKMLNELLSKRLNCTKMIQMLKELLTKNSHEYENQMFLQALNLIRDQLMNQISPQLSSRNHQIMYQMYLKERLLDKSRGKLKSELFPSICFKMENSTEEDTEQNSVSDETLSNCSNDTINILILNDALEVMSDAMDDTDNLCPFCETLGILTLVIDLMIPIWDNTLNITQQMLRELASSFKQHCKNQKRSRILESSIELWRSVATENNKNKEFEIESFENVYVVWLESFKMLLKVIKNNEKNSIIKRIIKLMEDVREEFKNITFLLNIVFYGFEQVKDLQHIPPYCSKLSIDDNFISEIERNIFYYLNHIHAEVIDYCLNLDNSDNNIKFINI